MSYYLLFILSVWIVASRGTMPSTAECCSFKNSNIPLASPTRTFHYITMMKRFQVNSSNLLRKLDTLLSCFMRACLSLDPHPRLQVRVRMRAGET